MTSKPNDAGPWSLLHTALYEEEVYKTGPFDSRQKALDAAVELDGIEFDLTADLVYLLGPGHQMRMISDEALEQDRRESAADDGY